MACWRPSSCLSGSTPCEGLAMQNPGFHRGSGRQKYKNNITETPKRLSCTNKPLILPKIGDGNGAISHQAFCISGPGGPILDADRRWNDRRLCLAGLDDACSKLKASGKMAS